jgi:hypothetical protein
MITYDVRIHRFEVSAGGVEDLSEGDDRLDWDVAARALDESVALVSGYFRNSTEDYFVQLLSFMVISHDGELTEFADLKEWAVKNAVDRLYDATARQLKSQAALMSISLRVPEDAPETEIEEFPDDDGTAEADESESDREPVSE